MERTKKLRRSIIAVVICILLATTAWATEQIIVSYSATLDDAVLCVNQLEKTVKLTAKVDELVDMDAFTAQVTVPEGWEITGIANSNLNFTESNFNLENGMILWYSSNAVNVKNDLLADVTVEVPAGTHAGEYQIAFEIIDISRDWGMPWENGKTLTATLTVAEHADGEDNDHLCDYGCGEVADDGCHDATDDGDHKCDECENTADVTTCIDNDTNHICDNDSACTVYSTGDNAHKDGDVVDNKCEYCSGDVECDICTRLTAIEAKTATCQETGYLAYWQCACGKLYSDATAETEITDLDAWKAEGGAGYIAVDANNHAGEDVTYTKNGDTHSATYDCCGGAYVTDEAHNFESGNCVCGAKDPADPVTGLKGDVNLDGQVTSEDAVALLCHVLQATIITDPVALENGEVTNDVSLTSEDAVKILQYALKAIDSWD